MLQDRRQYERLVPNSPQLVLLDESKYSLLFDLSEGGLALEGFTAKNPQDVIALEFDLPEGNGCIAARAEVAWTSGSGYRSGLRFPRNAGRFAPAFARMDIERLAPKKRCVGNWS